LAERRRAAQQKERLRLERERARERAQRKRLAAQKAKAKAAAKRAQEREAARRAKEREIALKRREKERRLIQARRDAERRARQEALARQKAEQRAKREAAERARAERQQKEQERREQERRERELERARIKAEREAERERVRRAKEEERAKREAVREAYRKAKEVERERIRAAREAARRALEGRIAEATRNANKLGAGRSSTTRFYSPRAIPDQSGTTRRLPSDLSSTAQSGVAVQVPSPAPSPQPPPPSEPGTATNTSVSEDATRVQPPSDRVQAPPENIEERYRGIEERLRAAPESLQREYRETLDMSWIYHDSALEGVVYTFQELKSAVDPSAPVVADSSLQPVVEEIRRHKAAIELVRELGDRRRAPITVDVIRRIYLTLHPEEGDLKTVKYRRDIPQHRLYFHEYAHPEKITYKVRQVVDWLNGPEPKKLKSPIRVAARAHYELLRVYPFQTDSGKVARLFMNLLLLRSGYPLAIIHSTERQRYYEALKGALPVLIQMVTESMLNGLSSIEKLLEDHDVRPRSGN